MWKEIDYLLEADNESRKLRIYSHFEGDRDVNIDKGIYTLKENSVVLGDMHVCLYLNDDISWNGKPDEFTDKQLKQIATFIKFQDLGDREDF